MDPQFASPQPQKEPKHIACARCRERKVKCDGTKPSCRRCLRHGQTCQYTRGKKQQSKVLPKTIKYTPRSSPSYPTTTQTSTPSSPPMIYHQPPLSLPLYEPPLTITPAPQTQLLPTSRSPSPYYSTPQTPPSWPSTHLSPYQYPPSSSSSSSSSPSYSSSSSTSSSSSSYAYSLPFSMQQAYTAGDQIPLTSSPNTWLEVTDTAMGTWGEELVNWGYCYDQLIFEALGSTGQVFRYHSRSVDMDKSKSEKQRIHIGHIEADVWPEIPSLLSGVPVSTQTGWNCQNWVTQAIDALKKEHYLEENDLGILIEVYLLKGLGHVTCSWVKEGVRM
ncbi:hypothetical protein B0J11DRAFT_504411 [Dendryphion nanum]|uniref:Zn(2)-C6 fungal-type domain-containing protein n=1 Tax=Dendryphion nanum TaxID=256645 RepID=A0A9P9E2B1_9PLEO|nr:hypothetical protein B0J11DRAFT_504411 [Dendryphion nanum]